jgi:hypothetical protein
VKRREVERAPWWVSYAAPKRWWVPAMLVGFLVGLVAFLVGAPPWIVAATGSLASLLADVYWRLSRFPSEDAPFSPLARRFYRRPNE